MKNSGKIDKPAKNNISAKRDILIAATLLFALTFAYFGDIILFPGNRVLSHHDAGDIGDTSDTDYQYLSLRQFGFSELKKGTVPLWDPYNCSGTHYLANPESGLFYPLNLIFLIMPVTKAINISTALHVFLMGLFMFFWAYNRKLHYAACLFLQSS